MIEVPAVVELRFADEEPIKSFIEKVASAAGHFAAVDEEELPEAARLGVEELRAACEAVGATVPDSPKRDEYAGVIVIEWPAAYGASPYSSMAGCKINVTDALTGKPIRTATRVMVCADVTEVVTADLTMFADENGDPILDGQPVLDGDEVLTGVFPFFVSEMRVAASVA